MEVRLPQESIRLGRGEFFGELAMLLRCPRNTDVVAISYCQHLTLNETDFRTFLKLDPKIREQVDLTVAARSRVPAPVEPVGAG